MLPDTQLQPGLARRDYTLAVQPSASALPPGTGLGDPAASRATSRAVNLAGSARQALGVYLRSRTGGQR